MTHETEEFLVIRINHAIAGFFAYLTFAINQLIYAERHGMRPVVHFGPVSGEGTNAYYDPEHGENMWDYYFEPVAGITYAELEARLADPTDPLTEQQVHRLSDAELWDLHWRTPESVFNYPYGMYRDLGGDHHAWYDAQRSKAHRYLQRYVRLKPHVTARLDQLHPQLLGERPVIGLHLRGTDKNARAIAARLARIMPPRVYFRFVDEFLEEHPDGLIFVATDQSQFIDQLRDRYGERIRCLDVARSSTFINPFYKRGTGGYRKGEDVLLDALLLSRCDRLIKCCSAVGEYAIYFNPSIPNLDVNYVADPWPQLSELKRRFIRLRWRLLLRCNPNYLGRNRRGELLLARRAGAGGPRTENGSPE